LEKKTSNDLLMPSLIFLFCATFSH
jgi:hypothetical protein